MMFLEAKNVTKQFANHLALDGVDIQVFRNRIFGLLGPNGAGKTTFIRIVNQIMAPDSGELLIEGRPVTENDVYRIGYLPEERGLYKKMKVGEQALYLSQLKGLSRQEAKKRLTEWFEKLDIMSWWNKRLEALSKGMQQKVQFVTTVVHNPELLIFDEPFSGFDPVNAELLKKEILELKKKGATIIFSTHNMSSVEELCDDIALINDSKVVLSGNVEEIRNNFKTNMVRLQIKSSGNLSFEENESYSVLSVVPKLSGWEVRILKKENISYKELICMLLERYDVFSFEEELPSMKDIFIKTVRNE
ncbi:MAG: ATP-binding cassette domain-containing protein [Candidatus Azobacteroides sp.]|nr:ATP-binding cassette domain-containing protein [Candidatus Azobacteroides sp.]